MHWLILYFFFISEIDKASRFMSVGLQLDSCYDMLINHFPIHIDTRSMGQPIVYVKGSQVKFSTL